MEWMHLQNREGYLVNLLDNISHIVCPCAVDACDLHIVHVIDIMSLTVYYPWFPAPPADSSIIQQLATNA